MSKTIISLLILFSAVHISNSQTNDPQPGRIFLSIDQGEQWTRADRGLPPTATVNDFAYFGGILFAVTDEDGVYISRDSSKSWQPSNSGLPAGVKVDAIRASGTRIVIGTNKHGIFISERSGEQWYPSNNGLTNRTVRTLHAAGGKLFAGTNDGIFVSADHGGSWRHLFAGKQINGITSVKGVLYAAHTSGVMVSYNEGERWTTTYDRGSMHNISAAGQHVFALSYEPSVVRSGADGTQWTRWDAGLPAMYTFHIAQSGKRLFACQWDGIYGSDDEGVRWFKTSNGLPSDAPVKEIIVTDIGIIIGAGMKKR